jgi:hypothetical protein
MFGVLAQILGLVTGWLDGGSSFGQMSDAITKLVQQHTIILTAFTAAWWAMWDAFSDMAKYAAANRRHVEVLSASRLPQQPIVTAPANNDGRRVL